MFHYTFRSVYGAVKILRTVSFLNVCYIFICMELTVCIYMRP